MPMMPYDKFKLLLWSALLLSVAAHAAAQAGHPLAQELWQQRALIISVPAADHVMLADVKSSLQRQDYQTAFAERRMVLYEIIAGKSMRNGVPLEDIQNRALLDSLQLEPPYAASVWLVGLDGGIKLQSAEPVDLQQVFQLIDGMPMRQNELR